MNREEVQLAVSNHNYRIERFRDVELPKMLKERGVRVKDGMVNAGGLFLAMQLFDQQNFYKAGMVILDECRKAGWDVKINAQSNELVFRGGKIND